MSITASAAKRPSRMVGGRLLANDAQAIRDEIGRLRESMFHDVENGRAAVQLCVRIHQQPSNSAEDTPSPFGEIDALERDYKRRIQELEERLAALGQPQNQQQQQHSRGNWNLQAGERKRSRERAAASSDDDDDNDPIDDDDDDRKNSKRAHQHEVILIDSDSDEIASSRDENGSVGRVESSEDDSAEQHDVENDQGTKSSHDGATNSDDVAQGGNDEEEVDGSMHGDDDVSSENEFAGLPFAENEQNTASSNNNKHENTSHIADKAGDRTNEEQDEELDELNQADRRDVETYRKESRLFMAIQGLRQKQVQSTQDDSSDARSQPRRASVDNRLLNVVDYRGHIFHKNKCYQYQDNTTPEATVGILSFLSGKNSNKPTMARCVLIVPFEETFLGIEDEGTEYHAGEPIVPLLQVAHQEYDLPLRHIIPAAANGTPPSIPEMMYEPQQEGRWRQLSYTLKACRPKRRGKRQEIRCLELFAGCGGMAQGLAAAGITVIKAIEKDPVAVETYSFNHKHGPLCGDVGEFLQKCSSNANYRKLLGRIDYIHASPPCQGFSQANRNGGQFDQANNELSKKFVDAMSIFLPPFGTFENVIGMWNRKNQHHLKNIMADLMRLGYQVRLSDLTASDYGDPQNRPRFFIFCSRLFVPMPPLPVKTHGDWPKLPRVTAQDAIGKYQDMPVHAKHRLHNMQGKTTSLKPGEHGVVRLQADLPCGTIRASSIPPFHPTEDRCISVREAAALQGFPDSFVFWGDVNEQYKQVGNAVPIGLATAVGWCVRGAVEHFLQEEGTFWDG